MIGMGTTHTEVEIDYSQVMSPFAATVFTVMLGAFAIMLVGGITTFIVLVTRHYISL
jgi:hypothetical protein